MSACSWRNCATMGRENGLCAALETLVTGTSLGSGDRDSDSRRALHRGLDPLSVIALAKKVMDGLRGVLSEILTPYGTELSRNPTFLHPLLLRQGAIAWNFA